MDFARPGFIAEEVWEQASESARKEWSSYGRNLAELCDDARFRAVVARWIDENCGTFAATVDPAEAALPGHVMVMTLREGRRQVGIGIMRDIEAVAPKMWMRALYEMRSSRIRGEGTEPPERPKE